MRVEGIAHLEGLKDPVLFVANHVTLGDHALVLAALPIRLRHRIATAMEGERLRDWLHPPAGTSWFMRLRCVDRGDSVLVFPEGERAPRGQMHVSPFKAGIGLLAKELNVEVVPVKLHGLYELKRRGQYFASPGMVRVVFGEPIKFDTRMKPAEIAEELERRVSAL